MVEITGRSTIKTVLKDPACSKWLRDALLSADALIAAGECKPADILGDATIARLIGRPNSGIGYPRFKAPAREPQVE